MGKVYIGGTFRFMGCEGDIGDELTQLFMWNYPRKTKKVKMSIERRKKEEAWSLGREELQYRSLEGILMYLGNEILPQSAMMASKMQQRIGNLKIIHMLESNNYVE